ncbi:rRNA pseudouridine synthase [Candidatus Saccharibacteria bacterium]|nr:rRNA pseudouridine synthase [Candidatus Saccharibacteria bacterium]
MPNQSPNQQPQSNPLQSPQQLRLNKFLAERLGISRREADDLIADGKVFVDDTKAVLGTRISPESKVRLGDEEVAFENNYIYIMMNKPVGYVCSRKRQGESPTIYELLPAKYQKLKTVGRLDKDSSGLILFTNDGDFAFKMTHPKFAKTKVYHVELNRELEPLHQQMIADFGVELPDGVSKLGLTRLREGDRFGFEVTMSEGRNRQIRRTFNALGYEVKKLHRISFGKYDLGTMKSGSVTEVTL